MKEHTHPDMKSFFMTASRWLLFPLTPVLSALGDPPATPDAALSDARPVITEFLTENKGGLRDEDGGSPDWIEIHNPGPEAVDLGGWHLSDTPANPAKWRFPASVPLEAGARLVVFASSKDRAVVGQPLHT